MIMENSSGQYPSEHHHDGYDNDHQRGTERGSFEWYDANTAGERYYCEGGPWFSEDMVLNDFDGNFDLPPRVVQYL